MQHVDLDDARFADDDDMGRFCGERAIVRVRRRLASQPANAIDKAAFLVLSGSFNPVHTQHVQILEGARRHLEDTGWLVVEGFLAPSSDEYVRNKLSENALGIRDRKALCELAVENSNWLSVCAKAEFSSRLVSRGVRSELEWYCQDLLRGTPLTGVEVMGSDTAVRIFTRVLDEEKDESRMLTHRGRVICCFLRADSENPGDQKGPEMFLTSTAARLGIELTLLDPASCDPPIEPVSSRSILELVRSNDWAKLQSTGWLHPAVLQACQLREHRWI